MLKKTVSILQKQKFFFPLRSFSSREKMEYDVLIVGGGPAGLSAAIQLKKLEAQHGKSLSVCLIDKGSAIGSHILSGNCFEAKYLDELFPNWKQLPNPPPIDTEVKDDRFLFLRSQEKSISIPNMFLPHKNHGNYVISLGDLSKWLAEQAMEMGVDVFEGFSASDLLFGENGNSIMGVRTGDFGIGKNGEQKENYMEGIDLSAKQTIIAEGCRGKDSDPYSYGLGVKEVWEVPEKNFQEGLVQHTVGWPLDKNTYGGSFLYHMKPNLVHFGLIVGLDYKNPYLSPYEELQKLKTHKDIKKVLEGGKCISYGARTINEGSYYSIPKVTFPGGMLVGCSASLLNVMKIKGTHNAMKSGMLAADSIYNTLALEDKQDFGQDLVSYETSLKSSDVYKELYHQRNVKNGFKKGLYMGMMHAGIVGFITRGKEPWSFRNKKKDSDTLLEKSQMSPIEYPKHDGKLTFDLLENLARSGTNHDHDQPAHLKVKNGFEGKPLISLEKFGAPEEKFCPAKVYEFVQDEKDNKMKLQINAQNCLHCKACSIKMIDEYIEWTVPEAKGGPNYSGM